MANKNNIPTANLPLPPLEYDVQYMNSLVRILNYFMQQQDYPGSLGAGSLYLSSAGATTPIELVPKGAGTTVTVVKFTDLPTSATGLVSGQVWNNAGTLNIVP